MFGVGEIGSIVYKLVETNYSFIFVCQDFRLTAPFVGKLDFALFPA